MGKPKNRRTSEEETALRAGVNKYGTGKWKNILADEDFAPWLFNRTNVDLKDKWRNIRCDASNSDKGTGPRCRWVSESNWFCQIIKRIDVIRNAHRRIKKHWKLLHLMLPIRWLWLKICPRMPRKLVKRWKDLRRFLKRAWHCYKWLKNFKKKVEGQQMEQS